MFSKLIVAAVLIFGALQLLRPGVPVQPATSELKAPPAIVHILDKDCYSCHSDQRRLSWFDQIVPAYWLVRHDILTAREHLNFSTLGAKAAAGQKATLYEAVNMIQLGAMPLPDFVKLHPEAKVTDTELAALKSYLAPWSSAPSMASPPAASPPVNLAAVAPELNGIAFDPSFEDWKLLSTTDRGDNNTFRFILGNHVAVKAAQTGNISPWPDGARFAKVAWQQQPGPDSIVQPGNFIQVELMIKNARLYKDTQGWGWGRWRGLDLKPYGQDAHFVNECTGCHQPLAGNDYVYSLPISTAQIKGSEVINNAAAALPVSLPYQPLAWNAITMFVDPVTHTTSTLYGNSEKHLMHPPGSVLALVTWARREDPHWFGARIPATPRSVEFLQIATTGQPGSYRRFAGAGLMEDQATPSAAAQRTKFLLDLAPARLP